VRKGLVSEDRSNRAHTMRIRESLLDFDDRLNPRHVVRTQAGVRSDDIISSSL